MQSDAIFWTATQRKYITWIATPQELRNPRFERDLAKQLRVAQSTLWRWRCKPEFWQAVKEEVTPYLGNALPEAMEALKQMARQGSYSHLKMYFEMLGLYVPKIAPTTPDGSSPYAGVPTDALWQEIASAVTDRSEA